ncbi:hypothetical protein [Klebsiella quasipneumoniae]|uniref:hypothetical protein n=1 Tax=Klebsiella quasipneumoniae TaxID=1463165 RepID=UPI00296FBB30|nr:hypothetical protein [Klebsiella quasipneumoniae]
MIFQDRTTYQTDDEDNRSDDYRSLQQDQESNGKDGISKITFDDIIITMMQYYPTFTREEIGI